MKPIINPDLYHGIKKDNKFFEGWYFKIVDKYNKYKFAFIPGIDLDKKSKSSYCFIQIVDGYNLEYNYLYFDVSKFKFNNTSRSIKGILRFTNTQKWPDNFINPGRMGLYNCISFMEFYNQVYLVNGSVKGSLLIDGSISK